MTEPWQRRSLFSQAGKCVCICHVKIDVQVRELQLANSWKIANARGANRHQTVVAVLRGAGGVSAVGEAAPAAVYGEFVPAVVKALTAVDASRLSFKDVAGSMSFLETIP